MTESDGRTECRKIEHMVQWTEATALPWHLTSMSHEYAKQGGRQVGSGKFDRIVAKMPILLRLLES